MTMQISKTLKRTVPLILAVMLIVSAMFVPTAVSAATKEEYEALGLHKTTEINFDGVTTPAEAGITTDFSTAEIVDGALHIAETAADKTLRFDAYGDIETVSMDIKVDGAKGALPYFVFYDETYTDNNNKEVVATSLLQLSNSTADSIIGFSSKGLSANTAVQNLGKITLSEAVDWTTTWITVTFNYGASFTDITANNASRLDLYGNSINCKTLTTVSFAVNGKTIATSTDYSTGGNSSYLTSYGVNKAIYDGADNEKVSLGFNSAVNTDGITIDNIKVTYRDNAAKVTAIIDEIGDVAATDASLAKIVKAETAYGMLTDTEKAAVTNYATLTAARAAYDTLMQNADVTEVVNLIDAIGTVDASAQCLAKIEAAEAAYAALSAEKQALVTNYATLTKALKDYNAVKYGLYADTVFDFETDLSGITSDFATTEIVDGAMHIENNGAGKNLRFDSYGNIEKYSLDIKMAGKGVSPTFVFYDETYTDKDGNPVNAVSKLFFEYSSDTLWKMRGGGLCTLIAWDNVPFTNVDWTTTWVTVTLTYGKDYAELAGQTDRDGNALYNKYLSSISFTVKGEANPFYTRTIKADSTTDRRLTSYGVNRNLTDADDNTNVTLGFESAANTVGMYVDNIMVAHNNAAAVEAVSAINTMAIDNSADCAAKVADIAKLYDLLPASQKTEELTAKINSAVTALEVIKTATAENLPTMDGASVRALPTTQAQNLCFTSTMPTATIEGYSIVEYGAVMFPTQLLKGQELTLNTSSEEYKAASASAQVGETAPTVYTTELGGIDVSGPNCGVRISARSFVKYSNGTNEFVLYSTNDKAGYSEATPTAGINKGVANRSVFSTARAIAKAVLDTETYPEATFGSVSGTLADNATGTDVLAFIYENRTRIDKIVRK